jgi:RES domain-containing protein
MTFYRAQRGFALRDEVVSDDEVIEVETAHPPERMRPAAEFVRDGRANPRGIPYLYLAGSPKTAMSEVRPWIESRVTLAAFKTVRDCLVVDCSLDKTPSYMLELDLLFTNGGKSIVPPDAQTKEAAVWGDIAYAFSKPVEPDDSALDYLPTQILAEAFRADGYDGIIYKSLLNRGGTNIVLFNTDAAEISRYALFRTQSINFGFKQIDSTFYMSATDPEASSNPLSEEDHPITPH